MAGRGEHSEIMSFVGRGVDSELSGNMIDLCPVGALTSKPFRYEARTWELSRRKSISPHDSLGANLIVQVKNQRVMRVLPLENEDGQRAVAVGPRPLLLRGPARRRPPAAADDQAGQPVARGRLERRARVRRARAVAREGRTRGRGNRRAGGAARHARGTAPAGETRPRAGLGQHRLPAAPERLHAGRPARRRAVAGHEDRRHQRARPRAAHRFVPAQGPAAAVGPPAPRDEARLPADGGARRRRRPADAGREQAIVRPGGWVQALAEIAAAIAEQGGASRRRRAASPPESRRRRSRRACCRASARRSCSATRPCSIRSRPSCTRGRSGSRRRPARRWGVLAEAGNTVGAHLAGALPRQGGLNARQMVEQPRKAMLLWNVEPEYDTADPHGHSPGAGEGGYGHRVLAVSQRRHGVRRRHPADRAVHRDGRHVRELRRARAELQRRRAARGRGASRMEGAARARQPARSAGLRLRDAGTGARRGAAGGRGGEAVERPRLRWHPR